MNPEQEKGAQLWETLLGSEKQAFEQLLNQALEDMHIKNRVEGLEIDHIAVRYTDPQDVKTLHEYLEAQGNETISTAEINGRPIMIIRLVNPLQLGTWTIPFLELPYPAADHDYEHDGWEHIEFVIEPATDQVETLKANLITRLSNVNFFELEKSGAYKESKPNKDTNQLPNPTISIKQHDSRIAIKFHSRSIAEVVGQ